MVKIKYNKQVERQVYIEILKTLNRVKEEKGTTAGICNMAKYEYCHITKCTSLEFNVNGGINKLTPTFLTRKPRGEDISRYWWPTTDNDSRIKVIESCIRELDRGRKLNFFERLFRIFP